MQKKSKKYENLPHEPGCYLFKNNSGEIIYIGKAKDLKKRVGSYFRQNHFFLATQKLVREIDTIEWIVTNNEIEAYLLEARLVHENQPKYNIRLKDDKSYASIKLTREKFPRLVTARKADIQRRDRVFGPFVSGQARREILHLSNTLFKLRVCKTLPKRACLLYHIGQCSAPCIGKISEEEYEKNVKKAEILLRGKNEELLDLLKKEMMRFSQEQNYEQAKVRRDQIQALGYLKEKEVVQLRKSYNQDVLNYVEAEKKLYIQQFSINRGIISGRKDFQIDMDFSESHKEVFSEFIRLYYYSNDIPKEVIVPCEFSDMRFFSQYLSALAGFAVRVTVPRAGEKKNLLDLLKKNIITSHTLGQEELLRLKEVLRLGAYPRVIECFDISNLKDESMVGSLVQFREGKPDKSNYRRFKVKTVASQSDFDSMKEVILRRYYRLKKENAKLPDLVVVDGGKPQLTAALSALKEVGVIIPVIALAKREEEIYTTDQMHPLKLNRRDLGLKILQRIRNEAHRFAQKYHHLLRKKKLLPRA